MTNTELAAAITEALKTMSVVEVRATVDAAIAANTATAPKANPVAVAEMLRDALADAEQNVVWKLWTKDGMARLYATMRGNGNERGYLWIDKDGDVICDGWATSEAPRKREKTLADRIATLEVLCAPLGVSVYGYVS